MLKLSNPQRELLPLTPAVFFILFALVGGEKHGYAIMQQVTELSDHKFRMGPGTLYSTLQRLLGLALIEETARKDDADERRRYYRLSGAGKALLEAELARMETLLRTAHRKRLVIQHANK
ncbi:MAG: PadR family transcriptional regulator [Deltaproteobacteria bacterium]